MAIIKGISGLEVTILVDNAPLQEYRPLPDDIDDKEDWVTRYVIAEPGKKFKIKVERSGGFKHGAPKWDLSIHFEIDGQIRDNMLEDLRKGFSPKYGTVVLDSVETSDDNGDWVARDLTFADIAFGEAAMLHISTRFTSDAIIDNSAALPTSSDELEATKAIGEISIQLWRGKIGRAATPDEHDCECLGKVHEKALKGKAISHQTRYRARQ